MSMEFAGHHAPMKNTDVIVLGAGIVGVSVALHLARAGALVDRRGPGEETSYGNAGLIERASVIPYAFPRDLRSLLRYALNNRPDVRYHPASCRACALAGALWWHSAPSRLARAARAMLPLIERSVAEHDALKDEAGIAGLFHRAGSTARAARRAWIRPPPRPPRCRPTA